LILQRVFLLTLHFFKPKILTNRVYNSNTGGSKKMAAKKKTKLRLFQPTHIVIGFALGVMQAFVIPLVIKKTF